jgi:hypothetical protein
VLQFPSQEDAMKGITYSRDRLSMFNQVNLHIGVIRFTQTRMNKVNCTEMNDRLGLQLDEIKANSCVDWLNTLNITTWVNGNVTYDFVNRNSKPITGTYLTSDGSGYSVEIDINDPIKYYSKMKELVTNKWVDNLTNNLLLTVL